MDGPRAPPARLQRPGHPSAPLEMLGDCGGARTHPRPRHPAPLTLSLHAHAHPPARANTPRRFISVADSLSVGAQLRSDFTLRVYSLSPPLSLRQL